ncbi:DUF434 domain-containing protein [Gracilinema caldarium]|uniref:DUF434 domain-containing protein n=1 Tax=Gracilinema caldarium (strain ATCC 51460 / DSM 7334 / H1) TaxID=744872 RepID=F8F0Z9_GRAC1|nr:DUF434 domain-containing protein [Gracilinema caldarium]AEJ20285.1 protein of unknown function DUF434 [Gracilinema caldarium DSM 7334]
MNQCSPALIAAIRDYSLLLNKGYPVTATIKLVGDRYRLDRTERLILFRGVLDETTSRHIKSKTLGVLPPKSVLGVDGYNVLFTLINYKRGHPLFIGTDGLLRDAGGAHGRFEREEDLLFAVELLSRYLTRLKPKYINLFLDAPVSHSGEHRELLDIVCSRFGLAAAIETVQNADLPLQDFAGTAVASSDSTVALKSHSPVFDLARYILEQKYQQQFIALALYIHPDRDCF